MKHGWISHIKKVYLEYRTVRRRLSDGKKLPWVRRRPVDGKKGYLEYAVSPADGHRLVSQERNLHIPKSALLTRLLAPGQVREVRVRRAGDHLAPQLTELIRPKKAQEHQILDWLEGEAKNRRYHETKSKKDSLLILERGPINRLKNTYCTIGDNDFNNLVMQTLCWVALLNSKTTS